MTINIPVVCRASWPLSQRVTGGICGPAIESEFHVLNEERIIQATGPLRNALALQQSCADMAARQVLRSMSQTAQACLEEVEQDSLTVHLIREAFPCLQLKVDCEEVDS